MPNGRYPVKLATTTGDFAAYGATPAEQIRCFEGTGFRHLDLNLYRSIYPGSPLLNARWDGVVDEAAAAAAELGFDFCQAHAPDGKLHVPGEAFEVAARRELVEETGHSAKTLTHLGTVFASPGYVDEKIEVYFAELDDRPAVALELDHDEHVETVTYSRGEFSAAIRAGVIQDGKTLAVWALFLEHERKND